MTRHATIYYKCGIHVLFACKCPEAVPEKIVMTMACPAMDCTGGDHMPIQTEKPKTAPFYRFIANLAFALHLDHLAEWAMRKHREKTGRDFES